MLGIAEGAKGAAEGRPTREPFRAGRGEVNARLESMYMYRHPLAAPFCGFKELQPVRSSPLTIDVLLTMVLLG